MSASRNARLDGVRGLAILSVVLWHYLPSSLAVDAPPALANAVLPLMLAWSGVDLFFVLSGFLIGGLLLEHREASNYYRVFYTRRALRILPLYVLWLLAFVGLEAVIGAGSPAGRWLFEPALPFWSYATLTQNFFMASRGFGPHWLGVTWSLAVEEQFYLLLPVLIRLIPARRLAPVLLALICSAPLFRLAVSGTSSLGWFVLMPGRADSLFLGVLLAWAVRAPAVVSWLERHRGALYGVLVGGFLGHLALRAAEGTSEALFAGFGLTPVAVAFAALVALALTERLGPVAALVTRPWLQWLGLHAYGIYLFHQGLLGATHALLLSRAPVLDGWRAGLASLVALAATLLLARVSWIVVERPLVERGRAVPYDEVSAQG